MSNIEKHEDKMTIWSKDKVDKIRKIFAPDLTNDEFGFFFGLGKSLGANPFMREIWAVKYGNRPAQVFLGRDFYRKRAQEQPSYNGHSVDAIYSNDIYRVVNGIPEHEYNLRDRGQLVGAYCVVYRKDTEKPFFVFVEFGEYYQGNKDESGKVKKKSNGQSMQPTNWDTKGATMIKKVAESQGLRGAFQGVFKGTYDESEAWADDSGEVPVQPSSNRVLVEEDIPEAEIETQTNTDHEQTAFDYEIGQ